MSITIREAGRKDARLILDFIKALADYERLSHSVEATEDSVALTLFGLHPRAFCSIAEWNGAPAGFALWFYNYSTFLARHGIWLEDLFVTPEMRGRGVGKALLKTLARRCAAEGMGRLEWWVLDWNESSICFYRSLGAVRMQEWQVYRLDGPALDQLAGLPSRVDSDAPC